MIKICSVILIISIQFFVWLDILGPDRVHFTPFQQCAIIASLCCFLFYN